MRKFLIIPVAALSLALTALPAFANSGEENFEPQKWSWGMFGHYDKAQLLRGLQVYREVCSNCHGLNLVSYRNLSYLGLTEDEVKAVAAEKKVTDGPNDNGDMYQRPARPSDRFVSPFANEQAARVANNGALPPDLSLIVKARHNGPNYVYALMTGFQDAPDGFALSDGMFYNTAFPGHQVAMPPPIMDGVVTYADGTDTSKEQIAKDIVSFLNWAAEPELDERHSLGVRVLSFLVGLTVLLYALKRKIWKGVH